MDNRELNALIAEKVMGWHVTRVPYMQDCYQERTPGGYVTGNVPNFCADYNAAHLVLNKISGFISRYRFMTELAKAFYPSCEVLPLDCDTAFRFVSASPRQFMEAVLAATGVDPENGTVTAPSTMPEANE